MKETIKTIALVTLVIISAIFALRAGALKLTIACQAETITKLEKEIHDLKNPKQQSGEIRSLQGLNKTYKF